MNRTGKAHEIAPTPIDVQCVHKCQNIVGESPIWCPKDRCLYLVDIQGKSIHVFAPNDGSYRSFDLPDIVTSLSTRAAGGLILTLRKEFAFFDIETQTLDRLSNPEPDRTGNRFNDGKCDRQGRLWAGTMGDVEWNKPVGALYRLDAALNVTRMQDEVCCSNGTGWSPDSRTMYYTESFRYGIFAYDFDPDRGEIANRRMFASLDPSAGGFPDGLTVDAEGHVWSAQPVYGRVVRYDPAGKIERIIEVPVSRPTSCMFGDDDLDVLYVTSARETLTPAQIEEEPLAGSLFAFDSGVRGLPETPFAG